MAVSNPDLENVQTGVFFSTQEDYPYKIKTVILNGQEFYTPAVRDNDQSADGSELDFYLMSKSGTQREISPSGKITLIGKGNLFRPRKIDSASYQQRKKEHLKESDGDVGQGEAPE